jgi:hypothetical protein
LGPEIPELAVKIGLSSPDPSVTALDSDPFFKKVFKAETSNPSLDFTRDHLCKMLWALDAIPGYVPDREDENNRAQVCGNSEVGTELTSCVRCSRKRQELNFKPIDELFAKASG